MIAYLRGGAMIDGDTYVKATEIVLERMALSQSRAVRFVEVVASKIELEQMQHMHSEDLVLSVFAYLARTHPEEVSVTYPASWWDAVKDRFRWLQRLPFVRPPSMREVVMRKFAIYPEITIGDGCNAVCIPVLEKEERWP